MFYLLENPGDTPATVTLTHLLEDGAAPIAHVDVVPPFARRTVLVNDVPGLSAAAAFATIVTSDVPIVAERAMYLNTTNRTVGGRHGGPRDDRAEHVVVVRRRGDGVLRRLSCCSGIPAPATPLVTVRLSPAVRDDDHQVVRGPGAVATHGATSTGRIRNWRRRRWR